MKKILAIILTICLLSSALSVTAFAALLENFDEIPIGAVLRVSALKKGEETPVVLGDYTDFEDGWNAAMELAGDKDDMKEKGYDRIIVDLYTDWNADDEGRFSDDFINGAGFSSDTILIPEGAKVTLNLNEHTIDRDLSLVRSDGEVIFIDADADVIINNGTIKGGFGDTNDAGAIYIDDNVVVTLNNVNIDDNFTSYDGGGIYVGSGSILTVNGGSFKNNGAVHGSRLWTSCGGAVCVDGGSAFFNGVEFKENIAPSDTSLGAAIYVEDGKVVIENCTFDRNGIQTADWLASETVIHGEDSSITITNSTFTDNVGEDLFYVEDSNLIITGGSITKTSGTNIFYIEDTQADIESVTITDNACGVMTLENSDELVNMISCTLGNNTPTQTEAAFVIDEPGTLIMLDCTLGDTTFSDKQYVKITTSEVTREEALIGIELLREDGTVDSVRYYKDLVSGWDYAVECAKTSFVDHIAVTLYADWNTHEYGVVSIPENARMTLNLGGHKIDRATEGENYNGEVLYISANADVIINNGTITGGNSETGAGGIHIKDNARVVLNDVKVDDNSSAGTNGAAIAVYNGATLVMNGGSISDNFMKTDSIVILLPIIPCYPYGTLYVEDATATLNNVTISDNRSGNVDCEGAAIYADNSTVTLNDCVVSGNINAESSYYAESVIGAEDSTLIINNTDFTDNGKVSDTDDPDYCSLFELVDCKLTMNGGKITGNNADKIFYLDDTQADITGVTITGNASIILDVDNDSAKVTLTECTLGNNDPVKEEFDVIVDTKGTLVLNDCELGDTTFENKKRVDLGNGVGAGSLFGEGSLTMIVSILALAASIAAIGISVASGKKKAVSASEKDTTDEE